MFMILAGQVWILVMISWGLQVHAITYVVIIRLQESAGYHGIMNDMTRFLRTTDGTIIDLEKCCSTLDQPLRICHWRSSKMSSFSRTWTQTCHEHHIF